MAHEKGCVAFFVIFDFFSPMHFPRTFITMLLAFLASLGSQAQERFIENGRQWPQQVRFKTDIPGGQFYLENKGFTVNLYDDETVQRVFAAHTGADNPLVAPEKLSCHAYTVGFVGASEASPPLGLKAFETSYSYFLGNDPERWSGGLRGFEAVRYSDLYPGIALKVYRKGNLKYDFIVAPGVNPDAIRLRYDGVKPKINASGELVIKTSVGTVTEAKPFAYQVIDGKVIKVECNYRISGKEVSYTLGAYDDRHTLIIDPELIFSTYSGSTADNFGFTATYDIEGHLYGGGSVFGMGYPTTTGAFQAIWAGGVGAGSLVGTDIGLTKFNLEGTDLIYSTYIGGSSDELPHSLITDSEGNLYMLGTSGSSDFPISSNAFQSTFNGGTPTALGGVGINYIEGCDMVITRLNATGSGILGSTYVGGAQNDGVNTAPDLRANYADEMRGEIELNSESEIVIGSSTYSSDFPLPSGGFQTVFNEGQEGVVFVMSPDLSAMIAGTYYGGSDHDAIYSIDVSMDMITVGGGTRSTDLAQAGSPFQATYGGGEADGFIATFNNALSSLENMTYYGSEAYDQIYFVERDKFGNAHIYGQTEATGSTFIFNAGYSVPNSGMLLCKFEPELDARIWSTVFGDGNNVPNLSPSAFSVDICNRVYLSGWGGTVNVQGSTNGLPVTDDAFQSSTTGSDFYFLVLEGDASALTYASFYGGQVSSEHVDGGTSRFDNAGKIYQAVCAGCGGNDDFPIFPENAHSPTNNSTNCNMGVAKIDFDLPRVIAGFGVETQCLPAPVVFTNNSITSPGNNVFQWDFGDGNTSNLANPSHQYNAPGVYTATLTVINPLACNLSDTTSFTFELFPSVEIVTTNEVFSCSSNEFDLEVNTNGQATSYIWATDPDFQTILLQGPNDSLLTFSAQNPQTIYIQASAGPCLDTDSINITPAPSINILFDNEVLCTAQEISIPTQLTGGSTFEGFQWEPEAFLVDGQGSQEATFFADQPFTIFVSGTSQFGCLVEDSLNIFSYPIALNAPTDTLICDESPLSLTASSDGLAQSFQWSSTSNFDDVLNAEGDSTIIVTPGSTTYYHVQAFNELCSLTDSVAVGILSLSTSLPPDFLVCAGDTVILVLSIDVPSAILEYRWEPDELIVSGQGTPFITAVLDEAATFTVVTSRPALDCSTENQVSITTSPLGNETIVASANPSVLLLGSSSQLSVIPIIDEYQYNWDPPTYLDGTFGTQVISTPQEDITYTVYVTDSSPLGTCAKTDTVRLTVTDFICEEPFIYVPNAFTPNGDGENDLLFVRGQNIAAMKFSVYDRWGELVFETTDQSRGWDGTYKGRLASPAVFVYHLEVDCGDGQRNFQKGNVSLLR